MKQIFLIAVFIFSAVNSLDFLSEEPPMRSSSIIESILPGMGYSTDGQTLAKTVCYKTETLRRSGQTSFLQMDKSVAFSQLVKNFNVEGSIKGGYSIFSANAMLKYFQSLEDTSYSFSVNYYQRVSHNVMMTFSYDPDSILTETGKKIYNDGKNPMFRIICGDTLITSFEEGAALILSLKIFFATYEDKKNFEAKAGLEFTSFVSASAGISRVANDLRLNGRLSISAYQMGGDPTQLAKILNSKVIECEIKNIEACQQTAKTLLNYASTEFPSQFKKDPTGIWDSPLIPITQFKKDLSVGDFGLTLAPSYATKEVDEKRKQLIEIYNMANYYSLRLANLIKYYSGPLSDIWGQKLKSCNEAGNILINGTPSGSKALDCFEFPFKCLKVYDDIMDNIDKNLETDIAGLLDEIKSYSEFYIVLSGKMCLPPPRSWTAPQPFPMRVVPMGSKMYSITIVYPGPFTLKSFFASDLGNFKLGLTGQSGNYDYLFEINATKNDITAYKGRFTCALQNPPLTEGYEIKGIEMRNPYYFEKYRPS